MKVFFASLGCDKNLVDSEVMLSLLAKDGFTITDDENDAEIAAEFRDPAVADRIQVISQHVDVALRRLQLAQKKPDERRFAGAGIADDEDKFTLLDVQGDPVQRGCTLCVRLVDVLKRDDVAFGDLMRLFFSCHNTS